jgi:hypothetical protein
MHVACKDSKLHNRRAILGDGFVECLIRSLFG